MSMNEKMQEKFAMFYGMAMSIGELAQPIEMSDEERVSRVKNTLLAKMDSTDAISLETCIHCGMCAEACHYYMGTHDPEYIPIRKLDLMKRVYRREISPLRWIHRLYTKDIEKSDLDEYQHLVFDSCTECGRCSMICPMGIHIADMVGMNRAAFAEAGMVPKELLAMQQAQCKEGTIFNADEEVFCFKMNELKEELGFDIPVDRDDCEVMVLTSGLDLMLFDDALKGTAKTLQHLGRSWTFFTEGYEGANFGLLSGHEDTQAYAAKRVIDVAEKNKIKVLLTPECGHAFPALRWFGAEMVGHELPFEIMSVSEYLGREVMEGRLKLTQDKNLKKVTIHDPCKVGRVGGSFDESRAAVKAMGIDIKETYSNRETNFCCGGGAGVFLIQDAADIRQKAYEVKVKEVKDTGCDHLVVSCGSCRMNFENGKIKSNDQALQVDSLAAMIGDHLPEKPAAKAAETN
ncbi:MAG: (Fe-S)-binding protein [Gammaproteobacteria bacterium]